MARGFDWEKARRQRNRAADPEPIKDSRRAPTRSQLRYIEDLSVKLGQPIPTVSTRYLASIEIERLKGKLQVVRIAERANSV